MHITTLDDYHDPRKLWVGSVVVWRLLIRRMETFIPQMETFIPRNLNLAKSADKSTSTATRWNDNTIQWASVIIDTFIPRMETFILQNGDFYSQMETYILRNLKMMT